MSLCQSFLRKMSVLLTRLELRMTLGAVKLLNCSVVTGFYSLSLSLSPPTETRARTFTCLGLLLNRVKKWSGTSGH